VARCKIRVPDSGATQHRISGNWQGSKSDFRKVAQHTIRFPKVARHNM
jgi:hypothetical protein